MNQRPMKKIPLIKTIPPFRAVKNAELGLKLSKQYGRGGTMVGRHYARTIVRAYSFKEGLTIAQIKKINSYFPRHINDHWDILYPIPTNGAIAWLLWGGWEMYEWTKQVRGVYGF
jgi:hypothetical protein